MAVELIIKGQRADLDGVVAMPLTKQFDDLTNPVAVKNMLSKTISLPATPVNNKIFGNIWRIDHINGGLFDPSKREDFVLVNNGALVAAGYIKLTNIKKAGGEPRSYDVHLYGGLGDFFYSLSDKDMKDIVLGNDNLSHIINAAAITSPPDGMIYFFSYQGKYDSFDSQRVYDPNNTIPGEHENGFVELANPVDEHQRNEFRSYYQRPAFRVSDLITAVFAASEFNVSLSERFKALPYWNKTYLALRSPDKTGAVFDYSSNTEGRIGGQDGVPFSPTYVIQATKTSTVQSRSVASFRNSDPVMFNPSTGVIDISSLGANAAALIYDLNLQIGVSAVMSATFSGQYYFTSAESPTVLTLLIYDADSGALLQTSDISIANRSLRAFLNQGDNPSKALANVGNQSIFNFNGTMSIPSSTTRIRVEFSLNIPRNVSYPASSNIYMNYEAMPQHPTGPVTVHFAISRESTIQVRTSTEVRSGSRVNYSTFMPSGTKQLDFVKNYFKAFGMLWEKDPLTNDVSIVTRNEFFADYKILDWTDRIDNSKNININPLSFDYRFGKFSWRASAAARAKDYEASFTREYGAFVLDTGFEFDRTEKKFIEDNILTNAVMSMEYDPMFANRNSAFPRRDNKIMPAIFDAKDAGRERNSEVMQLFFWEGMKPTSQTFRITDDAPAMLPNGLFCWTVGVANLFNYPAVSRITTHNGERYSLDFSKPSLLYYPSTEADYPAKSTIYRRFWDDYMKERLSSNTRVMTCNVWITAAEFANWKFNTFVKINGTLWHVNKIADFDPLKQQSTKVELIRVGDIQAYINGQNL